MDSSEAAGRDRQLVADLRLRRSRPGGASYGRPAGDCYAQHTCLSVSATGQLGPTQSGNRTTAVGRRKADV